MAVRGVRRREHHLHLPVVPFGEKMHRLLSVSSILKQRVFHILLQRPVSASGDHAVYSIIIDPPVADVEIGILLQLLHRLIIPVGVLLKAFLSPEKSTVRLPAAHTQPGRVILQLRQLPVEAVHEGLRHLFIIGFVPFSHLFKGTIPEKPGNQNDRKSKHQKNDEDQPVQIPISFSFHHSARIS